MPLPAAQVSPALHEALMSLAAAIGKDPDIPADPPALPLQADIGPGYIVGG